MRARHVYKRGSNSHGMKIINLDISEIDKIRDMDGKDHLHKGNTHKMTRRVGKTSGALDPTRRPHVSTGRGGDSARRAYFV